MADSAKIKSAKGMINNLKTIIENMRAKSEVFTKSGVVPTFSAADELTLKNQLESASSLLDEAEAASGAREDVYLTQAKNSLAGLSMMLTREDSEMAIAMSQHKRDAKYEALAVQRALVHQEVIEGLKLASAIIAIL